MVAQSVLQISNYRASPASYLRCHRLFGKTLDFYFRWYHASYFLLTVFRLIGLFYFFHLAILVSLCLVQASFSLWLMLGCTHRIVFFSPYDAAGVIATVAAGITVKFLGRAMINDARLLDDFWVLIEHMLNTVLFALGGAVWGTIISNGESHGSFVAEDWGYVLVLYIFCMLIRALLFGLAYPLTSRIGLKTNVRESIFQVYGGLRGAVGIALAIALDVSVERSAGEESPFADDTNKAFGLIGGIACM